MRSQDFARQGLIYIFLVIVFIFYVSGLTCLPFFEFDEPWYSEAAREMTRFQNFVIPRFNNNAFLDQPPLFFWCQQLSYRLFGDNDFGARFPSTIFAVLTALVVYGFGRRLFSARSALFSALAFALSFYTVIYARVAHNLMMALFFSTMGLWSLWELSRAGVNSEGRKQLLFWGSLLAASMALAFLTKGLVAMVPLLGPLLYFLYKRSLRTNFWCWVGLAGILGFLVVSVWALPVYRVTGGKYFQVALGRHFFESIVSPVYGNGPSDALGYVVTLPYYFFCLLIGFFPWTLFLFPVIRSAWHNRADARVAYLAVCFLFPFILVSLAVTKYHFLLLLGFPALALLLGRYWELSGKRVRFFGGIACLALVLYVVIQLVLPSLRDRVSPVSSLCEQSWPFLKKNMEWAAFDYQNPDSVWYFRRYVNGWKQKLKAEELEDFMHLPGPRFCLLRSESVDQIFQSRDPSWKTFTAEGLDGKTLGVPDWPFFSGKSKKIIRADKVRLTLILKPT